MLTLIEKILFAAGAAVAIYFGYREFSKMFAIIGRGSGPDKIAYNHIPERIKIGIEKLFTQGNILRNRTFTSIFHLGIAYAFIFYLLVNGVDFLEGYLPHDWHFWADQGGIFGIYRLIADLLTISGIVGMVYFLLRRFVAKDPALTTRENVKLNAKARAFDGIRRDSLIVGIFMITHLSARWLGAAANIAWHTPNESDPWQPFSSLLASALPQGADAEIFWHIGWWLALGAIVAFIPYFPKTKHAHLFMGPLNFATRPDRGALGALNAINFDNEDQEKFGVSNLSDLSQTQVLDAFACIMCNRCQDACPAYNTGKELSPAAIEINKRYYIKENFLSLSAGGEDSLPMLDFALTESAMWACTSCGACNSVCPVGNEPLHDIMDMRRAAVLERDEYPHELQTAFQGMERRGNPWGATNSRMEWADALPFVVPTVDQNPDFEYLFWVGCAGAFDPDAQRVAQSVATILNAAGVSYAVLGEQESCTGDPARRAGNEYMFYEMASANIETFDKYNLSDKRVVTSCPHCMTAIGTEYKQLGGDYAVFHHTQMIADLVGKNKLNLDNNRLEHVTFHDPCFLGRHNGIYDDPRVALEQAGMTLLEMDLSKANSFCCGAGGAQVWKEEEEGVTDQAVNTERYAQAEATGASTIAVGCPFCAVMLNDAKGKSDTPMEVKDVAQLVAERIMPEKVAD